MKRSPAAAWLWQLLGIDLLMLALVCGVVQRYGPYGISGLGDLMMGNKLLAFIGFGMLGGLGGLLGGLAVNCFKQERKHRTVTVQEWTARVTRPPVLYLRSFQDDTTAAAYTKGSGMLSLLLPFASRMTTLTEEEQLAMVMNEIGPFIAIGRPGEQWPELGAARMYVGDDEWQATINNLSV